MGIVPLNYIKVLGKRTGTGTNLPLNGMCGNSNTSTNEDAQLVTDSQPHLSRPRVRFDLNPRPAATVESTVENSVNKSEPTGILVRNDKSTVNQEESNC